MRSFEIDGRPVGPGARCFLIAEVAQSHDGELQRAHRYVDAAAQAGADAVKFQTHIADAESTLDEPFRVPLSGGDRTRFDYWRRMEFTPEQWAELARHCGERRLAFLSSAFSVEAVELLSRLSVPAWKVASGEVRNEKLLDAMMATGKPLLISSGMSGMSELAAAVARVRAAALPFGIFQCTSLYPTPLEKVGLNLLVELREAFACPTGLSDHSGTPFPGLAAIALGADMLELHLQIDPEHPVPDGPSSLGVQEFRLISEMRDAVALMQQAPVAKDDMATELQGMRSIFTRSLAPRSDLGAGTVLSADMLTLKKPGTGIAPETLHEVVGRRLKRAVAANRLLTWADIEP